jgi:hypothetical protein
MRPSGFLGTGLMDIAQGEEKFHEQWQFGKTLKIPYGNPYISVKKYRSSKLIYK